MDHEMLHYNALDSACMMEIHNSFWNQLETSGYLSTYKMTLALFPVLTFMQSFGMKVSQESLAETKIEVTEKIKTLQVELDEWIGHPLNVNSSKQCAAYFYTELGLPVITDTKSKKITTNDRAMQRLARGTAKNAGLYEAKLVQEIRGLQKLYSTYLNISFDEDNRMRGSYNPRGTKFGRLSSSKTIRNTGMNFQNLPQEFKKFLVADDGYILMEVDKRQAEWVVVAYLANDANMLKAIHDKVDVHAYTASLMFNLPISFIKLENHLVGHTSNPDVIEEARRGNPEIMEHYSLLWPRTMSLRQAGKKSNHALNYDETYRMFALQNAIEEKEAKRMIEMYHGIYPGIRVWHENVKRQLQKTRTLENCFGRKVLFMDKWCSDLWKAAYAMLPQSTVVDSINQGMVHIYHDSYLTKDCGINVLAQVHDSILLEIPIKEVMKNREHWGEMVKRIYNYISPTLFYNGTDFKIATDMKCGINWGERNDKNSLGMRDINSYEDVVKLIEGN